MRKRSFKKLLACLFSAAVPYPAYGQFPPPPAYQAPQATPGAYMPTVPRTTPVPTIQPTQATTVAWSPNQVPQAMELQPPNAAPNLPTVPHNVYGAPSTAPAPVQYENVPQPYATPYPATVDPNAGSCGCATSAVSTIDGGSCGVPYSCDPCANLGTTYLGLPRQSGWFFQYDHLFWGLSSPTVRKVGDARAEGPVNVGGNVYNRTNSMDTSFLNFKLTPGDRFDFGNIKGCRGWSSSIYFFSQKRTNVMSGASFMPFDPDGMMLGFEDANSDNIDDDLDADNTYGRNGRDLGTFNANAGTFIPPMDGRPDIGAPIDTGDLVYFLPTFTTLSVTNRTNVTSLELNDVHRLRPYTPTGYLDVFWGVRYFEFREIFSGSGVGGDLDVTSWSAISDNDIVGPQIGGRWAIQRGRLRLATEGRGLCGFNFQNNSLNGTVASNAIAGRRGHPVALSPNSFNDAFNNYEFAPMADWRIDTSYFLTNALAIRFGYSGLYVNGISRASDRVTYSLPSFALNRTDTNEHVLMNGINFGLEWNR